MRWFGWEGWPGGGVGRTYPSSGPLGPPVCSPQAGDRCGLEGPGLGSRGGGRVVVKTDLETVLWADFSIPSSPLSP